MTKGYFPSKDDIESSYRAIAQPGTPVKLEDVFTQLRKTAKAAGIPLQDGWEKSYQK